MLGEFGENEEEEDGDLTFLLYVNIYLLYLFIKKEGIANGVGGR